MRRQATIGALLLISVGVVLGRDGLSYGHCSSNRHDEVG